MKYTGTLDYVPITPVQLAPGLAIAAHSTSVPLNVYHYDHEDYALINETLKNAWEQSITAFDLGYTDQELLSIQSSSVILVDDARGLLHCSVEEMSALLSNHVLIAWPAWFNLQKTTVVKLSEVQHLLRISIAEDVARNASWAADLIEAHKKFWMGFPSSK